MEKPRILLNVFHPNLESSRGNRALLEAVRALPNLTLRDVNKLYANKPIDVKAEQKLLLDHDLIIFQHPFYWYSGPSLLKEWEDRVLERGFAYPPGKGDKLNGKRWLTAITTGGPEAAYRSGGYNNFTISELLRPFQQTANLCGMIWLPPFVAHSVLPEGIAGVKNVTEEELRNKAAEYRNLLESFE
ncbi:MAG: NAD(P)H-dependent oxidoreductase [Bdellovibrionales bacterium]